MKVYIHVKAQFQKNSETAGLNIAFEYRFRKLRHVVIHFPPTPHYLNHHSPRVLHTTSTITH
ncbi:MAG: hypothetical protein L0922_06700, partial [Candidatus Mariimomonas ferrooxydans]